MIDTTVFSEGYRKVWARLRHKGVRVWKERVLRLMREHGLLSPHRLAAITPEYSHDGTITAELPDRVWGTDATEAVTDQDGQVTVFAAIDHCTAECVGIHVVKKAHRFEALEPIRQGVREHFGGFSGGIAAALCLRHDHGSVYMSIKRFFRTLEEQLLWIRRFPDLDTLRMALQDFLERYKQSWILQRLAYETPAQARRGFLLAMPSAA